MVAFLALGAGVETFATLALATDWPQWRGPERTNISKPTVSAAVDRLVKARLVQPAGERPGRRGRTPLAFTVDSAAGYVIGVDIGSTRLRMAAIDIGTNSMRLMVAEPLKKASPVQRGRITSPTAPSIGSAIIALASSL